MTKEFRTLQTCLQELQSPLAREQLAAIIVQRAQNLVNASCGFLFIYNREKNRLDTLYSTVQDVVTKSLQKNKQIRQLVKTHKMLQLTKEIAPSLQTLIVLPIEYNQTVIALLGVCSSGKRSFTQESCALLKLYSTMAGLALVGAQLQEETEKTIELRDKFISLASHELRTPLTSLNGYIQLLHNKMANKPTTEARWIKELVIESNRLTDLVKNLLNVNRIQQGQLAFLLGEVDLLSLVEKAVKHYANLHPDTKVTFRVRASDDLYKVIGDADKLLAMLHALLTDIYRLAGPQGSLVLALSRTPHNVRLDIFHDGKSLPQTQITQVMGKHPKTHHAKDEIGIGLLLAKHTVSFHKGKMSLFSDETKGICVTIRLPAQLI